MEDILQVCGNRSSPSSSPSFPLEVGPLLQVGGPGSAFAPLAGPEPGLQTVFDEFQALNLASGSNNLQELFRK